MKQKWCLYRKPRSKWRYILVLGGIVALAIVFCAVFCKIRPFAVCSDWNECKLSGYDWKAEGNYEFLSYMDSIGVLDTLDLYQLVGNKNFSEQYFFSKNGDVYCWRPLSGIEKTSAHWSEVIHKSPLYFYKESEDDVVLLRHRNFRGIIVVEKIENLPESFVDTLSTLVCPEFNPLIEGISEEKWGADDAFLKNLDKRRKEDSKKARK